jgi:hypothetical protein
MRVFAIALAAIAILVPAYKTGYSQGTTGSITGTVTDPSGAPLSGAKVSVLAVDTNTLHVVTTSSAGTYTVPLLPPGQYDVTVDATGFKAFQRKGVVLVIDQVAQINASLKVGSNQEVVEVIASTPVLQTEQSSVGLVLDSHDIQNTPLNGRLSLYGMFALMPGVQNLAYAQDTFPRYGVTLSIGTSRRNSYGSLGTTLDGTANMEKYLERSLVEVPPLDALSEFKMITTGASAEFQQQAQITVATKSGGNQYHGELLWFNRSKGLNAKADYLGTGQAPARPPYERNEYGGNFAGPIVVPHLYNGHDKAFFFAAFEGYDFTNSVLTGSNQPTEKMRNGDFSEFALGGACYNGTSLSLTNPLTGVSLGTQVTSINPVSAKLLALLYPHPTVTGVCPLSGSTNTWENISYTQSARRASLRLDYKLTDHDQLRGTFLHAFYGPYPNGWNDSLTGGNGGIGEHDVDGIFGWTHAFSPSLLLDIPVSYKHLDIYRLPHRLDNFGAIIPGLGTSARDGAPSINISNPVGDPIHYPYLTSINGVSDSSGGYPGLEQDGHLNPSLTKVFARHTVKVGASFLLHDWYTSSLVSNGSFTFGGNQTYSGDAFADFLLGVPYSSSNPQPTGRVPQRFFTFEYGFYAQDDWKLTNKLTINYGLRVDKQWFSDDHFGRNSLWIPEQQKLVMFTGSSSYPTNVVSAYLTALESANAIETSTTAGMSSQVWDYLNEPKPTVAPRLGFAYEVMPKTVLRGSYGLFYNMLAEDYTTAYVQGQTPYSGAATYKNNSTAYNSNYFTMSNPFVTSGNYSTASFGVNAEHKIVVPYSTAYNLQVERELPGSFALRVGYIGMHNMKQNDNGGTNSMNLNVPAGNVPRYYGSIANSNYLYPIFANGINGYNYPDYHTTMNSLQIGLRKQYSGGSSINAQFQWSRILGVEAFMNPTGSTPHDSYGPDSGITPVVLQMNYTYALPFGHGRTFLANSSKLVDMIFGGWNYSGVGAFQSGQYFNITSGQSGTMWGVGTGLRPNVDHSQPLYAAHKSKAQWLNTAAFSKPVIYTGADGNQYVPVGNVSYDMLRGPGYWNMDMNLGKDIKWGEHYNVQLRADSFNTFNHPNLGTPVATSTSGSFGKITSTSGTPLYEARSVEFGTKFTF